jgi:hypothetical protein
MKCVSCEKDLTGESGALCDRCEEIASEIASIERDSDFLEGA